MEVWIEVYPFNDGHDYDVTIIERQAMKQAVTASGLMKALEADGRVALYINFDTNKAVIKDDSRTVLDQVAALLGEHPELKLSVEGHTDTTGTPERNKTLSLERAKAVVAALTAAGIEPGRLTTAGWGQEKPLADNGTEEGRAKNRRVELVRK
jgi:outer membrane protein OmpA-like peptidoglycan-associated protein